MTSMNFDITAQDSASREFLSIAAAAEKLEDRLRKLDKMTVSPTVDLNIDPANRKLDQLKSRLDALKNVRTTVDLDGADKARKDVTDLVVELRKLRDTKVNLDLSTGNSRNDIQKISSDLKSLRDAKVNVTVSVSGDEKIDRLVAKLATLKDAKVKVTVDVDDARVSTLDKTLSGVTGKTHTAKLNVDDGGSVDSSMSRLQKWGTAIAAISPLAVASFGSSTAAVASFGGAIATAVPITVAALGMLGGVMATVQVGTQGVGLAMGALAEGDMKKFKQALGSLSPEAQKFTLVLKDLYLELKQGAGGVQDKMFDGLSASLKRMGEVEVPMLVRGMGGVATELNLAAKEVMAYVGSAEGIARQTSMWVSTQQVVANLRPAVTDIVAIMFDLGAVGGKVLADISDGAGTVTQRWREWIAEARNSGQLEEIMRGGVEVFTKLGSIIGNTGSILASFYSAATTAGSDFLSTLDRGTEAAARFLKSAEGQNSLVTFFTESRAAIDALMPGLAAFGRGAMEAIRAFGETQGLSTFGAAVGEILTQVGAVIGPLGTLAGNVLQNLANGASIAAQALGPLVTGLLTLLNATGPVGPAVVAMVVAFKSLSGVSATVTALGTAVAGTATKWGMYATAVTGSMSAGSVANTATEKLGGALSKLGAALPIIGAAFVGAGVAVEAFGSKADTVAQQYLNGSMTMQQAINAERNQIENLTLAHAPWLTAAKESEKVSLADAKARQQVAEEIKRQYDALSPMAKLQADVAVSQKALNDLIAAGKGGSAEAAAAAAALATAEDKLKAATDGAAAASKTHSEALRDQVQAAQQLLAGMLSVEDALAREATAQKAANEAVNAHGAGSAEAKTALNDYAQAADAAAQAVGKQAESLAQAAGATDPAAQGTRAYGAALLQMAANATGPAQTALLGYISKLSDSQLAALSAGAEATGFATKVMQLPDGRIVKIAVDPETGKIVSTQQLLDAMGKNPVMIKIGADTLPADQAFQRVLTAVQQGQAIVNIDGQNKPALDALAQVGRDAGLANATVNINGQTVNAQTALTGFITAVQTGNPMVNINGQDVDARAVFAALQGTIVGAKLDAALGLNPANANATLAAFTTSATAPITKPLGAEASSAMQTVTAVDAAATKPTVKPMGGDPAGANAANAGVNAAVGTAATKPMLGNPADANAKNAGVNAAVGTAATKPMLGNPADANAKNAAVGAAVAVPATKQIKGDASGALAVIGSLPTVIKAIYQIVAQKIGFEGGGILPMASGGVIAPHTKAYAGGGTDKPGKFHDGNRLTPMSGRRAAVVAPRTYRVIGDRQRNPEVFIPLDGSKTSLAYTGYAANQLGYALTPLAGVDDDESDTEAYGRGGRRHHRGHHRRRHHRHHHRRHRRPGEPPATGPAPGEPPATGPGPATPPATAPVGTTYTTSQVSTTAPLVRPAGSMPTAPIPTTPGGGGGIDLSALITEVQAVKAAVLATGPNNTDVVTAVGRVERAIGGDRRGGSGYRAQCRRSDGELSRI